MSHFQCPKIHDWKQAKPTRFRVMTSAHRCTTSAGSPTLGLLASRLRRTPITCQRQTQHNQCYMRCRCCLANGSNYPCVLLQCQYYKSCKSQHVDTKVTNVLWCRLIWGSRWIEPTHERKIKVGHLLITWHVSFVISFTSHDTIKGQKIPRLLPVCSLCSSGPATLNYFWPDPVQIFE